MRLIVSYLLLVLATVVTLLLLDNLTTLPSWYTDNLLLAQCVYVGSLAGILYLLRAVYLHRCVYKDWTEDWYVWYFLRPLTSAIAGGVSFIFMKAGLLVLDAASDPQSLPYGYLALAFVAGYNVDNFLRKLESVAKTLWGIKETRVASTKGDATTSGDNDDA